MLFAHVFPRKSRNDSWKICSSVRLRWAGNQHGAPSIGVSLNQSHQSMRIMDQTLSGLFGYGEASILFLDMDRNDLPK